MIYNLLGSLPSLEYLHIDLISRAITVDPDERFTDFEGLPYTEEISLPGPARRNGDIKNYFINRAVDETLARAIFDVITSSKQKTLQQIETLCLKPAPNLYRPVRGEVDVLRQPIVSGRTQTRYLKNKTN